MITGRVREPRALGRSPHTRSPLQTAQQPHGATFVTRRACSAGRALRRKEVVDRSYGRSAQPHASIPASRKHPSLTVGIGARERRWKGPKPGGGACSRCSSVDSVAATANKPRGLIRRRESAELANLPRTDREPHGMDFLESETLKS